MRQIKFRARNIAANVWQTDFSAIGMNGEKLIKLINNDFCESKDVALEFQQFTGLHDKNGLQEVYEGDIIDEYGNIKGNIYEMDKGETDLVIEGLGTSAWSKTEKAGLELGLKYAK